MVYSSKGDGGGTPGGRFSSFYTFGPRGLVFPERTVEAHNLSSPEYVYSELMNELVLEREGAE